MIKRLFTLAIVVASSPAMADIDSPMATNDLVVAEYQKMDALNRLDPSLANVLVSVNSRTATDCQEVSTFDELIKIEEVITLAAHARNTGELDNELLKKAVFATCTSLLNEKVDAIGRNIMTPDYITSRMKQITRRFSDDLSNGVPLHEATDKLKADYEKFKAEVIDGNKE